MVRKLVVILFVMSALLVTAGTALAQKPGAHWNVDPVCTYNSTKTTITCTEGVAAGLGSAAVTFVATTPGGCETRGNQNEPGGHVQSPVYNLVPRGGRINTPQVTLSANCPPGLNQFLGPAVTYTLSRNGTIVLQTTFTAT
jgi:hypothetical protein